MSERELPLSMSAPDIEESDIQGVVEVLRSGCLSLGPKTTEFEERMADYVGTKYAVAVSSGTAGLHLIVKALGIGAGDEVLVPSFTFAASANAVLFEGGTPVFVDIEPDTLCMDPDLLSKSITPKTRAIMTVDVFGHPVEWDAILAIAKRHDLKIIDDSCEALGAEYRGKRIGQFGDAAAFGFYANKQITTGEGGMVVTSDASVAEKVRSFRNQGRAAMGSWLEHQNLGYNYRITEMAASMGITQLKRIESFLQKRAEVARVYGELLAGVPGLTLQTVRPHVRMSWFVYVVRVAEGIDRDRVMAALQSSGIPTRAYFSPVHSQPYLRNSSGAKAHLPVTERIAAQTIALPFHNRMTIDQVKKVAGTLQDAITRCAE